MSQTSTFNIDLFSETEQKAIASFIDGCRHRYEFSLLIKHLHDEHKNPDARLWSLLRYVDPEQRKGLFTLLEKVSSGKGIDQIFKTDFISEIIQ
ncbi:hypothetical protein ACSTK1_19865 [Vibrio parahaemolyticus]|uniref:hypothetical protein n=1 Tax=Vibrio parahaemolyticus TaxID=670 RepID=UPI00111D8544|nr:hypothetical protein [Vibrio parahaemolyticus]ELE5891222.1 hypothetical protein [Vibrio fluvialis]MBE4329691.1 hypothetical protein [Vibrio parahaemolyticus]MBE4344400.1 hypothetical protein [Vibrio parahaemolyticus]MDF4911120.1 hypothetical protein [Vibrio parahaemolyticus]TOP38825.1 hypothetical protein CGH18_09285 [Vibrio parahaemolyticus]